MKALRVLVNTVFCLFLIVVILLTQALVFDLLSVQSSDVDPILPVGDEESVGILDLFTLWGTDIGTNVGLSVHGGAKYRVRNWFNTKWWRGGTGWVDVCVDLVAGIVKPVVVPIAQINAIERYTGRTMADFILDDDLVFVIQKEGDYASKEAVYDDLLHYYTAIHPSEFTVEIYNAFVEKGVISTEIPYESYKSASDVSKDVYEEWIRDHKAVYNNLWKLTKYNNGSYNKYLNKFVHIDDDGDRLIKSTAVVLCLSFYISIILAIFFVIRFPINFFQGRYTGRCLREDGDE
jgi:hypothetical protein